LFQVTDVNTAVPLEEPILCRVLLIQTMNPGGEAAFDNLIFARLELFE
jgi:hypothetical protein